MEMNIFNFISKHITIYINFWYMYTDFGLDRLLLFNAEAALRIWDTKCIPGN